MPVSDPCQMRVKLSRISSPVVAGFCLLGALVFPAFSFAAQCPAGATSPASSCQGSVQSGLSSARSDFGQMCPGQTIRDCDRVGGGWQCSSAVIGNNAPGGANASQGQACDVTAEAAPAPVAMPSPSPQPAPVAQTPTPSAPQPPPVVVADTSASDSERVPLVVGLSDANRYGNRFNGVNNRRTRAQFTFEGGSEILTLTVTGNDIDFADEVSVLVNGNSVGFLTTTRDNGSGVTSLPINPSDLRAGTNTLEFREKQEGWRWGVTDIMLTLGCNYPLVQN